MSNVYLYEHRDFQGQYVEIPVSGGVAEGLIDQYSVTGS